MEDDAKSIYRVVKKETNYTVMDNTGARDKRLSLKAKGILWFMLTKPDDWVFHRSELVKHHKDGLASLRSALSELKAAGYLKRKSVRENGKIVRWETNIYEIPDSAEPVVENQPQEKNQPLADFQPIENLPIEILPEGNRTLLNTDVLLNTDLTNTPVRDDLSDPPEPKRAESLPEILIPTALLFISQIGITDISEDDALCLRMLGRIHTPARIQKQVVDSVKRLQEKGSVSLETPDGDKAEITRLQDLPMRYIYNSIKNQSTLRGGHGRDAKSRTSSAAVGREDKNYAKGAEEFFA